VEDSVKPYYVILTGSKNNAGDYLIKYRAKKIFAELRPDRDIVDLDGWKPFDEKSLALVNNSQALILMGGPSLQSHMYPGIYALTEKLDDIKVPVVLMGVGWKSIRGNWEDTYNYPLSDNSIKLLEKIAKSNVPSSVRDFHTLNSLHFKGVNNVMMTGCPAYYDLPSIGAIVPTVKKVNKVAFSLGVSFIGSKSMEMGMKEQIATLKSHFNESEFEVVFHHGLHSQDFLKTHGATSIHHKAHKKFSFWLEEQQIKYVDISGSAENLVNYYSNVDLHIGYRVHAHIFMNSLSKTSILISEDGRGKATEKVIGGMVVDGFQNYKNSFIEKVFNKIIPNYDRFLVSEHVTQEIVNHVNYERLTNNAKARNSRVNIDSNFKVMKQYIAKLP
jgi:hypothetical protein